MVRDGAGLRGGERALIVIGEVGHPILAAPSQLTPSAFICTRWPATSATSCERWQMPAAAERWSLISLRKKLIKIGTKVTSRLVRQVPDGRGRWILQPEYSENVKFWSLGP